MPHMSEPLNTFGRRYTEISQWKDHAWYEILYKLESSLSTIDRNYELIQVKEKFGGLRFYIWSDSPRKAEMNRLIAQAELDVEKLERQKRQFDQVAVPPPPTPTPTYGW